MFQKSDAIDVKFADVGSILKKRREELGMNAELIAQSLKVGIEVIDKIESGDIYWLMEKVYYEGLLIKYCGIIGLKADKVLNHVAKDLIKISELRSKKFLDAKYEKRVAVTNSSLKFIILVSVLAFSVIVINTVMRKKYSRSHEIISIIK